MKPIKIKICNYDKNDIDSYGNFIINILNKYYKINFSEDPDYLFYHESTYDYLKYDCIRIHYTGENISPNFNLCDYSNGFDYINFEDRYYRLPLYLVKVFYNKEELTIAGEDYLNKDSIFTKENLSEKTEFCSFVYSNYKADKKRKMIFDTLGTYKKVNAAGSYLNNMDGKKIKNKLEFEMKHKFSIAFENSSRSGYTTEKIVSSLVAKTIPIYWGNPNIGKEFNTKRFINCHDYESFEQVMEKVIELDNNDEMYLQMINEPIAAPHYNFDEVLKGFDVFLRNIIDQPIELARRRTINDVRAAELNKNEKLIASDVKIRSFFLRISRIVYKPFKSFKFLENLKHSYFRNKLKSKLTKKQRAI